MSERSVVRYMPMLPRVALRWAQTRVAALGLPIAGNERKLRALRNRHIGERCFIIGNGPSLRVSDLDRLRSEVTFAANKVYLVFDQTEWRPTYYNVEDLLVVTQNYDTINRLSGFTKLLRWWPHRLLEPDEDTIFYDLRDLPPHRFPAFSPDPLKSLYCGFSVTYSSLQFAFYMGFSEVFLIGVDFSFSTPPADSDGRLHSQGESNHFLANYRTPGELWYPPRLDLQERAFVRARDFCTARDVTIRNATRGGMLEVFPRVALDDLF